MYETTQNYNYVDAGTVARQRFEKYLNAKLSNAWDIEKWEFYTFLLEQAKKHPLDGSGLEPLAYQKDRDTATERNNAQ
jgi:hypothetical protein